MYDLPPRRRISLILVKLGPAHWSTDLCVDEFFNLSENGAWSYKSCIHFEAGVKDQQVTHTHTHTDREQHPPTPTHTHDKNNTPNPQTNTPHKHLTTLEGGATTVRATSHAWVCTDQSSFYYWHPTCIAHTFAILLHDHCPIYDRAAPPLRMACTIQYWEWHYCVNTKSWRLFPFFTDESHPPVLTANYFEQKTRRFLSLSTRAPSPFLGLPRGEPDDWSKQAFRKIEFIKTLAESTRKEGSTGRKTKRNLQNVTKSTSFLFTVICLDNGTWERRRRLWLVRAGCAAPRSVFMETKKRSPNTSARANNTLHK